MRFQKDKSKESLKRTLLMNYPGCKSVGEAFDLAKASLKEEPKLGNNEPVLGDYELMKDAIEKTEKHLEGIDIENHPMRKTLGDMPLKNQQDVINWRNAWLKV